MYDTVIFDLDGTLLYTIPDLAASVNYALTRFGYPGRSPEEVRSFLGDGNRKLIERSLPAGEPWREEVLDTFMEHYLEHSCEGTKPYPGITDLLTALKKKGIKTAVVSNKNDTATRQICARYFPGLLDIVAGDTGGKRKPDPEKVLRTLEQLGGKKALYVGDLPVDSRTAANAHMDFCLVTWGFGGDFPAEKKADNAAELKKIILAAAV